MTLPASPQALLFTVTFTRLMMSGALRLSIVISACDWTADHAFDNGLSEKANAGFSTISLTPPKFLLNLIIAVANFNRSLTETSRHGLCGRSIGSHILTYLERGGHNTRINDGYE